MSDIAENASTEELTQSTEKKKRTKKEADEPQPIVDVFKENTQFLSRLFKLSAAKMLQYVGFRKETKNAAFDEDENLNEDWLYKEHCHIYRTVDSKGVPQEYCSPAGGHTHKMKINKNSKGEILSVECASGPLSMQVTKEFGKPKRVYKKVNDFDNHKHETIYVKSDKLSSPQINAEAAKIISREAARNSKEVVDKNGKKLDSLAVQ